MRNHPFSLEAITKPLTPIDSLQQFQEATFARLGKIMKPPGLRLMVRNVIGGGDQDWATVELVAVAECKSGMCCLIFPAIFLSRC